MKNLTDSQQKVLDWISAFITEKGYSPTARDIAAGSGFSVKAAYDYMCALRRKGKLTWVQNQARTIRVLPD
jgi:repressor LexA